MKCRTVFLFLLIGISSLLFTACGDQVKSYDSINVNNSLAHSLSGNWVGIHEWSSEIILDKDGNISMYDEDLKAYKKVYYLYDDGKLVYHPEFLKSTLNKYDREIIDAVKSMSMRKVDQGSTIEVIIVYNKKDKDDSQIIDKTTLKRVLYKE